MNNSVGVLGGIGGGERSWSFHHQDSKAPRAPRNMEEIFFVGLGADDLNGDLVMGLEGAGVGGRDEARGKNLEHAGGANRGVC